MTDGPDDRTRRARLGALPGPARLLVLAAICTGVYVAAWSIHATRHEPWQEAAISGAAVGLLSFAASALVTRWQGGPEASRLAQRAIRRRRIPDDGDARLIRTGLEGVRRVNLRLRWWFYGCLAVIALLAVIVAVLRAQPEWLLIGAIPVALGIAHPLLLRSRMRRIDALLDELDRRQAAEEAA